MTRVPITSWPVLWHIYNLHLVISSETKRCRNFDNNSIFTVKFCSHVVCLLGMYRIQMMVICTTCLYQTDSWADINQQIWKHCFRVGSLKPVLWTTMALVNKRLIWNVFEKEIATFDQALHLIFFVNSVSLYTNITYWRWHLKQTSSFNTNWNTWNVYWMWLFS